MLGKTKGATPWGIEAREVEVEADVQFGIPRFQLVGLPDTAIKESRDRVRAAIRNSGYKLDGQVVTINLAPADLRKQGNQLDLAIALALLAAYDMLPPEGLRNRLFIGELGLDGGLRPVRGGLAFASLARELEIPEILLPSASAGQAASLGAGKVIAVDSLLEAIQHVTGVSILEPWSAGDGRPPPQWHGPDLSRVKGQGAAKRALEIAAAGGHNLLMTGPPGTGKTLLARCLPGLLPPLTREEAITVTKIHSVACDEPPSDLLRTRPFRAPHASSSTPGVIGGGSIPRPGEVTLAHAGVLFLDELPEFRRETLESLRQPLEDGVVTVVRAQASLTFPARFCLVGARNPCPCGFHGDTRNDCRCSPGRRERYLNRISGPLLDRIDLHVEVPSISLDELRSPSAESSESVRERVRKARQRQGGRIPSNGSPPVNAALEGKQIELHCSPDEEGRLLLERAYEKLGLSPRCVHRIMKVARTLADLEHEEGVRAPHIAEAVQYRAIRPHNE